MQAFEALGIHRIDLNLEGLTGFAKYRTLWKEFKKVRGKFDLVVVPFQGFVYFPVIRLLTRKPIVYDALISRYDTDVNDRKHHKKWSIKGLYDYLLDWLPCRFAQGLLVDTHAYGNYFIRTFRCSPQKVHRMWTGTNRTLLKPVSVKKDSSIFVVGFQGKVVDQITGLEHIIEAMEVLKSHKDIRLKIMGPTERMGAIQAMVEAKGLTNVTFTGWIDPSKLSEELCRCDVLLGAFGKTEKLKRTIPLKILDALALKVPVVTGDTPGCRELLTDRKHCVFAELANSQSIAEQILWLKEHPTSSGKIAKAGYTLYQNELSIEQIAVQLARDLSLHSLRSYVQ